MLTFMVLACMGVPFFACFSGHKYLIVIMVTLVTFISVYVGYLNRSLGMMGMLFAVMCIVFTRFSITLQEIPMKALAIFIGGIYAFAIHYYILPVKPRFVYKKAQKKLLDRMIGLSKTVFIQEENRQKVSMIQKEHHDILEIINKFRKLPAFLNYLPEKSDGPKTAMIYFTDAMEEFLDGLLVLQDLLVKFRRSEIPEDRKEGFSNLMSKTFNTLESWKNALYGHPEKVPFDPLTEEIRNFQKDCFKEMKSSKTADEESELLLFQLIYQLNRLVEELGNLENYQQEISPLLKEKIKINFRKSIQTLISGIGFSNIYFRYTIQISLATLITMILYKIFNMQHGLWLVMFCIIVMKPNPGSSLKTGIYRIAGTILGIAITIGLVYITGQKPLTIWILMCVATIGFLYLSQSSYFMFSITLLTISMISLYYMMYPKIWDISIIRSYDTAIAVVIGVVISYFIWPNRANRKLIDDIHEGLNSEINYLKKITLLIHGEVDSAELKESRLKTHILFDGYKETYKLAMLEPGKKKIKENRLIPELMYQYRILYSLDTLLYYVKLEVDNPLFIKMKQTSLRILNDIIEILNEIPAISVKPSIDGSRIKQIIKIEEGINKSVIQASRNKYEIEQISNFLAYTFTLFRLTSNINHLWEVRTSR